MLNNYILRQKLMKVGLQKKSNSNIWKKPVDLFLMDCAKDLDNFKIQMINLGLIKNWKYYCIM